MALLPWTDEYRKLPTRGGTDLQTRRKIRGVGAAERALGNAWSRLSSWDKDRIGSQKNYAALMQQRANRLEQQRLQQQADAEREKGRQSILGNQSPSVLPNSTPTAPEGSVGTLSRPGGEPARTQNPPAGNASQMSVPSSTQPTQTSNRLVEHMGRQYPASIVSNPEARNKYDTAVEERNRKAVQLQNMDRYVKNEVHKEMNPGGELSPQEKLALAVKGGRVTNYDVNPEELQKRRRQRMGIQDPQMPEYTRDGQLVRGWKMS